MYVGILKKNSDSLEWIMEGGMIFPMKIFTLQMGSMDAMIGPYYKKGLRAIDSILTIKLNEHRFEYKDTVILPKQFYLSRSFNSDSSSSKTSFESSLSLLSTNGRVSCLCNSFG